MKITHVFIGKTYHLVPSLVSGFLRNINRPQYFYFLVDEDGIDESRYDFLKTEKNCMGYCFVSKKSFIQKNILDRKSLILVHGNVTYDVLFVIALRRYKNIHYICWGSGAQIGDTFKSRLASVLKRYIYSTFTSVITLMKDDEKTIQRDFKIKRIRTISYLGRLNEIYSFKEPIPTTRNLDRKQVVYLGNNCYSANSYLSMLDCLYPFKGKIVIHCMMNYTLEKNMKVYRELREKGQKLYGDDFFIDTKCYDLKDYPDYMNLCDIYICSVSKQTGLGAISTLLKLGKKVYITGKNYSWITSLGCEVENADLIHNISFEEFSKPFSSEILKKNYSIMINRPKMNLEDWTDFINTYIKRDL